MVATKTLIRLCSKSAFYVSFPIGLLFVAFGVFCCIYYSEYLIFLMPEEYIIAVASILGVLMLLVFGRLLWKTGSKIKRYLDNDYPTLKASFLHTLYVHTRLFLFATFIFMACYGVYFWQLNQLENILLEQIVIGLVLILSAFFSFTLIGTFTTGIITMLIAKIMTTAANADLSLMEYAE